jgi:hypothetical protein
VLADIPIIPVPVHASAIISVIYGCSRTNIAHLSIRITCCTPKRSTVRKGLGWRVQRVYDSQLLFCEMSKLRLKEHIHIVVSGDIWIDKFCSIVCRITRHLLVELGRIEYDTDLPKNDGHFDKVAIGELAVGEVTGEIAVNHGRVHV